MQQIHDRFHSLDIRFEARTRDLGTALERGQRLMDNKVSEIMRTAQDCKMEVGHIDGKVDRLQAEVRATIGQVSDRVEEGRRDVDMWRGQVGREMDESEARVRDMVAQR